MRPALLLPAVLLLLAGCRPPSGGDWRRASAAELADHRRGLAALAARRESQVAAGEQVILADGLPLYLERWTAPAWSADRVVQSGSLASAPEALWDRVRAVQAAEVTESSDTRWGRFWAVVSPGWPRPWTDGGLVFEQALSARTPGRRGGEVRELQVRSLEDPARAWIRRSGQDVIIVSCEELLEPGAARAFGTGSHAVLLLGPLRERLRERVERSASLREALGGLLGSAKL